MLVELSIKDFAIIDSLSVSFSQGFSVFTGETGAGKSIIIDAIDLVLVTGPAAIRSAAARRRPLWRRSLT